MEANLPVGNNDDLESLIKRQNLFFSSGATRSLEFRKSQLISLGEALRRYEPEILRALAQDLGKSEFEGFVGEVGLLYDELRFATKHLKAWMKPEKVPTPWLQWIGTSRIRCEPKGTVLIIGPWNYPFQLVIAPLVAAMAAGNCSVSKPSELAPHTAEVIGRLISENFDPRYISVVQGGVEASTALLKMRFDHIFFTGGGAVGKVILAAAARHLTPVTLELGGKSPCIVDDDTDVRVTAKRIVWGKFFNAGQTCVAPDYCLVSPALKPMLLSAMKDVIVEFFGPDARRSPDYGRIINARHFERLTGLLTEGRVVCGGDGDALQRYLSPTIIDEVRFDHKVMQDEIFGPILPIVESESLQYSIDFVNARSKPLALYFFSRNAASAERVMSEISYGGGCINDTLVHLGNPRMPFGGVGDSGMGAYHGKFGFETFSHRKSIVAKSFWFDPSVRYPPYGNRLGWIRKIMRA